jgi:tetratricopeptide (TPR) repeat protein
MIDVVMKAKAFLGLALLVSVCSMGYAQQAPTRSTTLQQHRALAQQYLAARQPEKAIPELEAVVALDPQDLEARANLGVLLFFYGDFAQAIPNFKAALEERPNLTKIQALLGIAERRTGDDADGRKDLEAVFPAITDSKLKIDVGQDLIESYSNSGELERATTVVAALLKLQPTDPSLLYTSYRLHHDLMVEAMLELGLVAPDSAQMHQAMAHELQRDHDLKGTIENLRAALQLDPNLPGIHFELAEALHASDDPRDHAQALEQYQLAVKTAPGDAKAQERLADIEVEGGNLADAQQHYELALKLQPDNVDAEVGLADVKMSQGDTAAAKALLLKAEAADPSNILAHYRLSIVYRKLHQADDVKREIGLYQHYKDEHEKLKSVYQKLRLASPDSGGMKQ